MKQEEMSDKLLATIVGLSVLIRTSIQASKICPDDGEYCKIILTASAMAMSKLYTNEDGSELSAEEAARTILSTKLE